MSVISSRIEFISVTLVHFSDPSRNSQNDLFYLHIIRSLVHIIKEFLILLSKLPVLLFIHATDCVLLSAAYDMLIKGSRFKFQVTLENILYWSKCNIRKRHWKKLISYFSQKMYVPFSKHNKQNYVLNSTQTDNCWVTNISNTGNAYLLIVNTFVSITPIIKKKKKDKRAKKTGSGVRVRGGGEEGV